MRRHSLGVLLSLLALNAFGGGVYAMAGAEDVPLVWLEGSVFSSYFIPGLILFAVVGGLAAIAAVAAFANGRTADDLAKAAGWTLVIWLAAQLSIVGFVSFLQPMTLVLGLAILVLAHQPRQLGFARRRCSSRASQSRWTRPGSASSAT